MNQKAIKLAAFTLAVTILNGCASIPPEFLTSMEKERDGIGLLKDRHRQAVHELVENWYNERLERLRFINELEIDKITFKIESPDDTVQIEALEKSALKEIQAQFNEAIVMANKIRHTLIEGYTDSDNWDKLVKLNSINLEMTRSLTELNAAQRKFYSELAGNNTPFPTDFINEQIEKLFPK